MEPEEEKSPEDSSAEKEQEVEKPTFSGKETESEADDFAEFGPIKRPGLADMDNNLSIGQPYHRNKSGKKTTIVLAVVLLVIVGGILLGFKSKNSINKMISSATPPPAGGPVAAPVPTEVPKKTLDKSEWSLEVLNGSGSTGLAKKIADKIKELGYPVVKVGNADKDSYAITQILVKKDLTDKLDLVIADLKDVIKIASFGGELKEGTASARVIIGKDSI